MVEKLLALLSHRSTIDILGDSRREVLLGSLSCEVSVVDIGDLLVSDGLAHELHLLILAVLHAD